MLLTLALPLLAVQASATPVKRWAYQKYFDLQGHRGGRGHAVENTLPSFAWGLISGVTTLEMDDGVDMLGVESDKAVGLTKDGVPIVWHDEVIDPTKCKDTGAATANDPIYPYVGKNVANLTLAQIKTLDCGSLRLTGMYGFPLAEVYPGTKLATLKEMFDFVDCATSEPVLFNIESKVNPEVTNQTRSPADFVKAMGEVFVSRGPAVVDRITHQSFDQYPTLRTAALVDDTTLYAAPAPGEFGTLVKHGVGPSKWLSGIDIDSLPGATIGERVARAAKQIKADILSPVATSYASNVSDISEAGYLTFTNKTMVDTAHSLGLLVVPWTINYKNVIENLLSIGVDGIITDYPRDVRILLERRGKSLPPVGDKDRILGCLAKLNQLTASNLPNKGY